MLTIKKWQDDLIGAAVVIGSVALVRDRGWYWKLPCLAAVYLGDWYLSDKVKKALDQARAKAPGQLTANDEFFHWFKCNVRFFLSTSCIYFMLEQPFCAFAASQGYNNSAAKIALNSIFYALNNFWYFKQEEKRQVYTAGYDGEVGLDSSKLSMLLKTPMIGLILHSFEGGISKYPKMLLSLGSLHFICLCLGSYNNNGKVDKNQAIEIAKRACFSSVCSVSGVEFSKLCNFDGMLLERITERVISSTVILTAPLFLST